MTQPVATLHRDRPRVVVADDDVDARAMLAFMLELGGFDVVLAPDGGEALELIRIHGGDVLISDLNMPVLDGLELCRAVRTLEGRTEVPIILWSNVEPDDTRVIEALRLPDVTFVSKMVVVTKLDAAIRRVLRPATAPTADVLGAVVAEAGDQSLAAGPGMGGAAG